MAKTEGTQNIPSEWLYEYQGALGEQKPDGSIQKRQPFRLPKMQKNGTGVSEKQKAQRERFEKIKEKFNATDRTSKERWYNAMPEYSSLLWYYNYFMLSGLSGNANLTQGGIGVIKSINHYTFTMPTGSPSDIEVEIDTVDPDKSIAFFYGAGAQEIVEGAVVAVYPYLKSLTANKAVVRASMSNAIEADCGVSIIEYI